MRHSSRKGAILLAALVFFAATFALASGLISYSVVYAAEVHRDALRAEAHALADAGLELGIIRASESGAYDGETIMLGDGEVMVAFASEDGVRTISATGYVPSSENPRMEVTVQAELEGGSDSASFPYGVQAGDDGVSLSGGARVQGNIYANGPVEATSGVRVTGSVTAAGAGAYIGGASYVTGVYVGEGATGDAWASHIKGTTVAGTLYCATAEYTNKICVTTRGVPPVRELPVGGSEIDAWKSVAEAGGTITGDYTVGYAGDVLGPRKIEGDLRVEGGGELLITGPLWVTGDVLVSGGGRVRIASSKGNLSEVIIADGQVQLSGGATLQGSGQEGSVLFFVSTGSGEAVTLSGGAGSVGLIAPNGTVSIAGGTSVKTVTARGVQMSGGAVLTYDAGLLDTRFTQSSSEEWRLKRGTYRVVR